MTTNNKIKVSENDYRDAILIAPSQTVNIVSDATNNPLAYPVANGLQVVAAGNAVVVVATPSTGAERLLTFTALPVGTIIPFPVKRVNLTGTTATLIGLIR
jgi:hypothetical protein